MNGGTALHLAATNGHSRCIRLLLADYIPSIPNFREIMSQLMDNEESISEFDHRYILNSSWKFSRLKCLWWLINIIILWSRALSQIINRTADGGITALHMAALNGQVESVQLLLELGASVSEVTLADGTVIDLIGFFLWFFCLLFQ